MWPGLCVTSISRPPIPRLSRASCRRHKKALSWLIYCAAWRTREAPICRPWMSACPTFAPRPAAYEAARALPWNFDGGRRVRGIGELVFTSQAGAHFGYRLLWVIALGTVGIVVFGEMSGR